MFWLTGNLLEVAETNEFAWGHWALLYQQKLLVGFA